MLEIVVLNKFNEYGVVDLDKELSHEVFGGDITVTTVLLVSVRRPGPHVPFTRKYNTVGGIPNVSVPSDQNYNFYCNNYEQANANCHPGANGLNPVCFANDVCI